jgi:hypothetical protein
MAPRINHGQLGCRSVATKVWASRRLCSRYVRREERDTQRSDSTPLASPIAADRIRPLWGVNGGRSSKLAETRLKGTTRSAESFVAFA